MNDIEQRLSLLAERCRTIYNSIGHSSGRPYAYFTYPPEEERRMRVLADEYLRDNEVVRYHHIDLVHICVQALEGQEEQRAEMLNDPARNARAKEDIARKWARAIRKEIVRLLREATKPGKPVVVLRGLVALHPITNPTAIMEALAEQEPRDPATDQIVPIIVLVPGTRPAQTSRVYRFLGLENLTLSFYRGEED